MQKEMFSNETPLHHMILRMGFYGAMLETRESVDRQRVHLPEENTNKPVFRLIEGGGEVSPPITNLSSFRLIDGGKKDVVKSNMVPDNNPGGEAA